MSTHFQSNGKIFNEQKRWSDLKTIQKIYINNLLKEEYLSFVVNNSRKPGAREAEKILKKAYLKIEERDIWIPFSEVRIRWNSIRSIANRTIPDK